MQYDKDVDLRLFGKPDSRPLRRMGVALARGINTEVARKKANKAASKIKIVNHQFMFASFLPPEVKLFKEPTSIALAQSRASTYCHPLSRQAIATAYIHQGTGGTPILLLHGFFDSSVLEFRS